MPPTLFDPTLSHGQQARWKNNIFRHQITLIAGNMAEELASLKNQFATGAEGWWGIFFKLPGLNPKPLTERGPADVAINLLTERLPPPHQGAIYLTGQEGVLAVFPCQGAEGARQTAGHIARVLMPEAPDNIEIEVHDLKTPNPAFQTLCDHLIPAAQPQTEHPLPSPAEALNLHFQLTPLQKDLRKNRRAIHILIVEDDAATAALLVALLNKKVGVSTAPDAATAIAQYRHTVPDMVLLDIGLPDVSGLEVLKHIQEGDPDARVVILTANAFKSNLEQALQRGAIGFMAKPFNRERLDFYLNLAKKLKNL